MMTVAEVITRARSQIGIQTTYRLGGGTRNVTAQTCQDSFKTCDCSAFVRWVLGIPPHDDDPAELLKGINGGWYNTDGMWWDARRLLGQGIFDECEPAPGALVIYPARWVSQEATAPQVGHVGIVSQMFNRDPNKVIHCSAANFRNYGDAIWETGLGPWTRIKSTLYAWPKSVTR